MSTELGSRPYLLQQLSFVFGSRDAYWHSGDFSDLGGPALRAVHSLDVQAVLAVEPARETTGPRKGEVIPGMVIGIWDMLLMDSGCDGFSKPQSDRTAALAVAADGLHRYLQSVLRQPANQTAERAAKKFGDWLKKLDVL
jgi:hypothetical protein